MKPIYLDHNASTPLVPEVIVKMKQVLEDSFGNPSSSHIYGLKSREIIEEARERLAKMINASPDEIIFTSGGSESNNMAIRGIATQHSGCHILTSSVEHPSVVKVCDYLATQNYEISALPVNRHCRINPQDIESKIKPQTRLITVMLANNETGTLQPLREISEIARKHNILVHTDAAQAVGKITVDVKELGVDLMTIAAHKMNGPKGIGALYIRRGVKINPLILGAGHESGLRAGTENVLEISGLGEAARLFTENEKNIIAHQRRIRDRFFDSLKKELPGIELNGHEEYRLPNTANIYFPECNAAKLLDTLPEIAASGGAACHAGAIEPSQVLKAMGISDERALGSIRFSFGRTNTPDEVEIAVKKIVTAVKKQQQKPGMFNLFNSAEPGCSCKLSAAKLQKILGNISSPPPAGKNIGFETGDDAAVYFIDDETAILSSVDFFAPIVDDPFDFGRIAAANALSDIYAMGGTPLFANSLVAFPDGEVADEVLEKILKGADVIAREAGIQILGGHSIRDQEMKFGLSVVGIAKESHLLKNNGCHEQDLLILTKPLGTGILAKALQRNLLADQDRQALIRQMVFLNKRAADILRDYPVSACTDVTGFGLLGHLSEMLKGSNKSAILSHGDIPFMDNVGKFARMGLFSPGLTDNRKHFDGNVVWKETAAPVFRNIYHDPQTSGGLLFSLNARDAQAILKDFEKAGLMNVRIIGRICEKREKLIYIE